MDFKDDIVLPHRKYICRKCWNAYTRKGIKKVSSTVEGYLNYLMTDIRNHPRREKYEKDIDLNHLLYLYELQEGRCAISNIQMTWGMGDDNNKGIRKPFNISVDRVDNAKGYTKDNVVLICNAINIFKNSHDVSLMRDIAKEITTHEDRLNEIMNKIKSA